MQDKDQSPADQAQLTEAPETTGSQAPAGEAPPTEEGHDVMPSLQESLRAAELKAAEHHDAWLRAKAETENVRRRAQEDIAKASKFAAEKFAAAMLPVKDSLESALAVENQTLESLKEGVELTLKQLASAFESAGLSEENPIEQKFDPNKHQAITTVESDHEPNTVVNVLQKGYLLHERVIRPALVVVSKAKQG
ncbi:MAG TPA: nucleotide exchange factor GrpE [Rhodocyclaceae bacterium]|nr:nucleotide exchange factor GrpE [Rhodocyclaceae bacterium]